MSVFAAIDIGSNSVRLKIARIVRHRLEAVHEDRVVTRLGESVFRFGALAPKAMDTTVDVLRRYHRAVQKYAADRVRVVATSALRDASNAGAFVDWVHSATGWKVEVISGLEEGRLIHLGVLTHTRISATDLLLIDLGGGSCELTVSKRGHIREMASLPLGAVRLTQDFLLHDPPKPVEILRLRRRVEEEIERVSKRIIAARVSSVVATSGTAAALAGAARVVERGGEGAKGRAVSRAAVARLAGMLARLDVKARSKLPGINPRRAEIIVAGAYVFAELMERCKLPSFRYSPLGLRDGLLAQMLAEHDRAARPRRQIEAVREDAVLAMCRRFQVDLKAAAGLRGLAVWLFRVLASLHRLPPEYEVWLSTAAMLSEVGRFVNRNGRHRHTHYLISHSEIFGFSSEQRQVIAAIARYLGKSRPGPAEGPVSNLSSADQKFIPKAVSLLRLAQAMNHGRAGRMGGLAASVNREKVLLRVPVMANADLAHWMLQKERAYFREVFGRDLVLDFA